MSSRVSLGPYLRRHAGYLVLVLVVMTIPAYLGSSYYLGILGEMATRFIMLLGLSLLVGQAGQISLGQAGFVGIGAYGSAILTTKVGLDPWAAMVLAAGLAAVIAGLVGMPTLRLKGYYLAMATLGVNEIIYILLGRLKSLTRGVDGISGIPSLSIGGLDLGTPRAYHFVTWGIALVTLLIALNLSRSRVGRSLRALHQSEPAAQSLGIDTSYRKVQVFMVAAVFASLAGSLRRLPYSFHRAKGIHNHLLRPPYQRSDNRRTAQHLGGAVGHHGHSDPAPAAIEVGAGGLREPCIRRVARCPDGAVVWRWSGPVAPCEGMAAGPRLGRRQSAGSGGVNKTMALLSVEGVSKSFGGLDALKEVSFAVHEGQIKALIGPNGAGKTTLFNVASGSYRPSEGRVVFCGVDVSKKPSTQYLSVGTGEDLPAQSCLRRDEPG